MAWKWDAIGTQLHHSVLVRNLRCVPGFAVESSCRQIFEAAQESGSLPNYGMLLNILRSPGIDMSEIASDLEQEVQRELNQQSTAAHAQQPGNGDSQPTGASTRMDASERTPLMSVIS